MNNYNAINDNCDYLYQIVQNIFGILLSNNKIYYLSSLYTIHILNTFNVIISGLKTVFPI